MSHAFASIAVGYGSHPACEKLAIKTMFERAFVISLEGLLHARRAITLEGKQSFAEAGLFLEDS